MKSGCHPQGKLKGKLDHSTIWGKESFKVLKRKSVPAQAKWKKAEEKMDNQKSNNSNKMAQKEKKIVIGIH